MTSMCHASLTHTQNEVKVHGIHAIHLRHEAYHALRGHALGHAHGPHLYAFAALQP